MKQSFRCCSISAGVLVLTLCWATIQTARAQTPNCATPTIDMKLLVVTNGKTEADFGAITQVLDYLGTPYDVLDMKVTTGGITASMLSDGNCHGYYQGVIFAFGGYIYTLPGMPILNAYEQLFKVRQVNWYMYPNNDFGFNYPYSGTIPDTGSDSASYTSSGASVFFYANTATPVAISNAFIYLGTPRAASTLPAGASVTPLLIDGSGNTLSLVYTIGDGREYLTQTFDSNQYLTHDLVLAYGLINWVTRGIFLGEYHVYAAAQVDDFFINDSEWIPGTPCTNPITHDRTAPDASSLPFFRINFADMNSLVGWQNRINSDALLTNFKLTLAFNGVGTTGNTDWTGLSARGVANDDLTMNVQKYQQYFHWITHTYDHPNSLNGLNKSDPYGDPNTPQVDSIDLEILTNLYVANGSGQNLDQDSSDTVSPINLTDFNPANLVSPGVTGMNDTLVPSYLVQDGISYAVSDTSVLGQPNNGPNPSPNVGIVNSYAPSLYEVPRRPNNVFFNAANWNDDQAEFSCIYNNPVQPPYNTYNAAQILDYVSSDFVVHMLMGDMDPEMFHQPNLHNYDGKGHSLISDTYDQTFSKYEKLYRLPVVSPTLDQLGRNMQNRNTYNLSTATGSITGTFGSNLTVTISVPSSSSVASAIIPVTGVNSTGAEIYGGQYISHVQVNNGQSAVIVVSQGPPPPPVPVVSSLTLQPDHLTGAQTSSGTVTLSGAAPNGGAQVPLSSGNAAATVPSSVTVPAGASSATFTINTSVVAASTPVTLSASYGGASASATLTVQPPVLSALTVSPSSVLGGKVSPTGTVTLSGAAPAGGAQVTLSSNSPAASVPANVTVPAGATTANFTVTTSAVATSTAVIISASYGGPTVTASLTIQPPAVSALSVSPTSVTGATSSPTGKVTLNGPAPAGGAQVLLSSNNAAASVPANVTVPAGATTANFAVTTSAVATSTAITISGSFGGSSVSATLTVVPPVPSALAISPSSVTGATSSPTGTVTLNGPAPAGGAQVVLSSNSAAVSVPANGVTVAAGATTATFTLNTIAVAASTSATVSASFGGGTQTAILTVLPPVVSSLTLNPTSVVGGPLGTSTGTVTLNGPAPAGGAQVLVSSNNSAASVPASVTVPAGSTSVTFTVTTSPVIVSATATISASLNGTTKTASLAITL